MTSGLTKLDIDGFAPREILETKHVGDAARSPFVPGSAIQEFLRAKILKQFEHEVERMKQIVKASDNPFEAVRVITNNRQAGDYFESVMQRYEVPGNVDLREVNEP